MKLILISSSTLLENEAQTITQLFEAGLESFHLRKPKSSSAKIKALLKEIPSHFHNRIVLHTHHKLARKFNVKGLHITKSHKRRKIKTWFNIRFIQLRRPKILLTTSFSSIGPLFDKSAYHYDYVFLSPIFDSLGSKFQGGYTEHSLRSALAKTEFKVIARGGIDIHSIPKANELGFAGIGLYSSFWSKKDSLAEFNAYVNECNALKIPVE